MFRLLGLTKVLNVMNRAIAAVLPTGELGRAIQFATPEVREYAASVTHRVTGALANAHTWKYIARIPMGEVFISPSAQGAGSSRPSKYGIVEHARGGDHAFYDKTVRERGQAILTRAEEYIGSRVF